jgi:hypothetical protein
LKHERGYIDNVGILSEIPLPYSPNRYTVTELSCDSGYLGVLQERKTFRNVLHLVREGCLGLLESHIYGCWKIYLINEGVFRFDLGGHWVLGWGGVGGWKFWGGDVQKGLNPVAQIRNSFHRSGRSDPKQLSLKINLDL